MNIIIDNYNLTIMVTDNEVSLNKCITLTSENESNVFCANENNLIKLNLERKIVIEEKDNLIKDDIKLDNNINEKYTDNIIFENTLSINNIIYIIIFLILITTGVIFVRKKK